MIQYSILTIIYNVIIIIIAIILLNNQRSLLIEHLYTTGQELIRGYLLQDLMPHICILHRAVTDCTCWWSLPKMNFVIMLGLCTWAESTMSWPAHMHACIEQLLLANPLRSPYCKCTGIKLLWGKENCTLNDLPFQFDNIKIILPN